MIFMEASEKNFMVCEEIIKILHENKISIAQSNAILDRVKIKIAQDTSVGDVVRFERDYEEQIVDELAHKLAGEIGKKVN